jgi:hypothetical protein
MKDYKKYNAENVLAEVEKKIASYRWVLRIYDVCDELSIFDWWKDNLTLSDLKQMRMFLRNSIKLGFNGYVCFKVGADGCGHGMWAHKEESVDGSSPFCDFIYHSFRAGDNFWDAEINKELLSSRMKKDGLKLSEIKSAIA